jgi:hypothetical protein
MRLTTVLGWTAGVAVAAFGAWAWYFGKHFADSGVPPRPPERGRAGETWWIVLPNGPDPAVLGEVLRQKSGTPEEGGVDHMVYVVRLARDTIFDDVRIDGRRVLSARRAVPGDLGQGPVWP